MRRPRSLAVWEVSAKSANPSFSPFGYTRFLMKRFLAALTVTLLVVSVVASMSMAAPNVKYQTFGAVTESPTGTFTITLATNADSGGVFINAKPDSGKGIGSVLFSFISRGDVAGGAPRFSIPIDTNGKAATVEFYAFLDAAGCGGTTNVATNVSTELGYCAVNAGPESFANWAAFAAAHPTYRVAPGWHPFIIADGTAGTYVVSDIALR